MNQRIALVQYIIQASAMGSTGTHVTLDSEGSGANVGTAAAVQSHCRRAQIDPALCGSYPLVTPY